MTGQHFLLVCFAVVISTCILCTEAWTWSTSSTGHSSRRVSSSSSLTSSTTTSKLELAKTNLHGEGSCFLPLKQLDQDYFAPRIFQIAGAYPGVSRSDMLAVSSPEPSEPGQWTYDFSDPEGPQLGTVAIEGSLTLQYLEDPVALICDHFSLNVPLPATLTEPVDLVTVVDRSQTHFKDRKFLVFCCPETSSEDGIVEIGAFNMKSDMPEGAEILGHVEYVQIPWLPEMQPTKSGFMEEDEYF